jgi:hypothetical protein
MSFKSPVWFPIAGGLSVINLVATGFAAGSTEPWHAGVHATLALGFGLWAQRLGQRRKAGNELQAPFEALEALEVEVSNLRQDMIETQERLDFTERLLAQGSEARRADPQR